MKGVLWKEAWLVACGKKEVWKYNFLRKSEVQEMKKVKLYILVFWVMSAGIFGLNGDCAAASETVAVTEEQNADLPQGWVKKKKNTYYYKKGVRVTGWKFIKGKKYYFDKKTGKLLTNTIAGTAKEGRYYVDAKGIRVTDPQIRMAVSFVDKHTKPSWPKDKKLKACYEYLWKVCRYERAYDKVALEKMPDYASYMLKTGKGNCYRGSAAFAYTARVLGYDSRVGVGGVSSRNTALSPHGWTEIKIKGKWYMCDISMQRYWTQISLYLRTASNYPFRYRCDDRYRLTVRNGKVTWR